MGTHQKHKKTGCRESKGPRIHRDGQQSLPINNKKQKWLCGPFASDEPQHTVSKVPLDRGAVCSLSLELM